MTKLRGMRGEITFLRKELASSKKKNERLNAELVELKALQEFWGNGIELTFNYISSCILCVSRFLVI
ncbi:MAG: hypothetical protein ACRC6N_07570 [Plesiomonas sp.]|uniref:hypothetical protein n=1 Tax=Plesiomonas sp. TaxID=2486279 RepID=UPI003F3D840D